MVIGRRFWLRAVAVALLCSGEGCRQAESGPPKPLAPPLEQSQTVARLHWLGLEKIKSDTNAAYFTTNILQRPESLKIGEELLQKLSRAPWTLLAGLTNSAAASNAASGLSLSLLRTLIANEVYVELQDRTNEAPSLALAVRLNPDDAALWASNSPAILADLPANAPIDSNGPARLWSLTNGSRTNYLQIQRVGDWTLVGFGQQANASVQDFISRIQRQNSPVVAAGTNQWLELDCDLAVLMSVFSTRWNLPFPAPRLSLRAHGDGEYVKTDGNLTFPAPLLLDRDPWMIPTNMIREPLVSFGAFQGLRPWLKTIGWIQDLQLANTPNQFFTWSVTTTPAHVFAAAPMPDVSAVIDRAGPALERGINSWLTNHALGVAEFSPSNHGIAWIPVPLLTPTFQALPGLGGGLLFGRLASSLPPTGKTAPQALLDRVASRTNLVYYHWEITETRLNQWLFLAQSLRVAFKRAQLPGDCESIAFLKAIAPKLGNTVTEVVQTGPSTLSFVRKSHCGFTGLELHCLADWAESPNFPAGFHSDLKAAGGGLRWNAKTQTLDPPGGIGKPK